MMRNTGKRATDRFLAIYLNDHRAAAAAGEALARRIVDETESSEAKSIVRAVADQITEDRRTLERVAQLLGVRANPAKTSAARVAERLGRLKFNGRLWRRSPLSAVIELEGLVAGIDAKRSLWTSLLIANRNELAEFDFDQLASRATQQRALLVPLHRSAAADALLEARPSMRAVR